MPCLWASIGAMGAEWQERLDAVESATTLSGLVLAALVLTRALAVSIVEQELEARAAAETVWPRCPHCGRRLRSKGRVDREVATSIGVVRWWRRVGRCPGGCAVGQVAPLDEALGLSAGQRTSSELVSLACLLAVYVPFATARAILHRAIGVHAPASAIWDWVRKAGERAQHQLEAEIAALKAGGAVEAEVIAERIRQLTLIVGGDGVMVPFRPTARSPKGPAVWREVKVAVLARLGQRTDRHGRLVTRLVHRRLVAVLGDIDDLADRLRLEALRQRAWDAPRLVWVSDGARGLWRLFDEVFANHAVGILDFYHAAGHVWEAAEVTFGFRPSAQRWFRAARHDLRHGQVDAIVACLRAEAKAMWLANDRRKVLRRVADYLERHRLHLRFPDFKDMGLPLGSGFVESAVKWLVQQRFKGVGMRWSEQGFSNLLLLRLAWANDRFDQLFYPDTRPSPNF